MLERVATVQNEKALSRGLKCLFYVVPGTSEMLLVSVVREAAGECVFKVRRVNAKPCCHWSKWRCGGDCLEYREWGEGGVETQAVG